jgi:hypothetical protein
LILEIKDAKFVQSNVRYVEGVTLLENFVVSINNVKRRVYLRRHNVDPVTGRSTGARDLENEQTLIESFNPGDLVNLTLYAWAWRVGKREGTKYYLVSIEGA